MAAPSNVAAEDVLSFDVHKPHYPHGPPPPVVSSQYGDVVTEKDDGAEEARLVPGGIGLLPEGVYDRQLHPWAAALRRRIVRNLVRESEVLAAMQNKVRTPFLDAYFVNTSSLGTHTFFMVMLPAFCFFGYRNITQGLIFILALGVYLTTFIKDLMCAPRPFAPPVHRLTISNHHKEYGFPSTHSVNSVSIALFFFTIIHRLAQTPAALAQPSDLSSRDLMHNITAVQDAAPQMLVSDTQYYWSIVVLVLYAVSIVYGRLYTAMHSFTDCTVGVVLGVATWLLYVFYAQPLDDWLQNSGWIVPAVVVPICLLCVHWHPEPVDDCPCFEDSIAFMSVVMGESLTRWYMYRHGYDEQFFVRVMAGRPFGPLTEMWSWWSIASAKMVVGVAAIFAWRIFAKFLLHRILPPLYRFLAQLMTLPHRRYYTPATDYKNVPPEKGLHAIPSVLDLPGMVELEVDGVSTAPSRGFDSTTSGSRDIKLRPGRGNVGSGRSEKYPGVRQELLSSAPGIEFEELGGKGADVDIVKHYDADVLTKVFVYSGIGALASGGMPIFFELIGWGMRMH